MKTSLSLRERVLLWNLVLASVWAGYFVLSFRPRLSQAKRAESRIQSLQQQRTKLVAALRTADPPQEDPAQLERKLRQVQAELEQCQETLDQWQRLLTASERPLQVQELKLRFAQLAQEAGLTVVSWTPWSKGRTPAGSSVRNNSSQELLQWCAQQGCRLYRVKLRGSYSQLVQLLRTWDRLPPVAAPLVLSVDQPGGPQPGRSQLEVELVVCF